MTIIKLFILVAVAVVAWIVLAGTRRRHKAQPPVVAHEPEPPTWQPDEAADRALKAETRKELEQCSTADLQAVLDGPLFMFSRDAGGMEFRWRITTRRRIAQELLNERAGYGPYGVTIACSTIRRAGGFPSKEFLAKLKD